MIVCSPQLGISPESGLGGEVYDRETLKALDNLGVKTLIVLPFWKKHPTFKHARIFWLPVPFVYPPWLFNFLVLPYLFFLQWKYKFNVLRVHSPYFVGPVAIFFKLFFPKVKIVVSYLHLENDNNLYNFVDKILINKYSLITTISETTQKDLFNKFNVNSSVIPCGVDPKYKLKPKNKKIIEKYGLKNKKVLLYLGQLIQRKNIPFLFKVIKKLPEDYILMICGDGPLRGQLEVEAPKGVIFTGKIPEDEKVDYYNLADVFVYPSLKEGFGLSVAEVLACGKSVLASNVPIVDNIPLNVQIWTKAILNNNLSHYSKKYSWSKAAKNYLKLISK